MYTELPSDEKSHEVSERSPLKMNMGDGVDGRQGNSIHDKVLSRTKSVMNHIVVLGLVESYIYSSVCSIWILYGRTFYDNTQILAIIYYLGYIIFSILALIIAPLSDLYGHDNVIIILCTILPIGLLLQAFAGSIYTVSVGYIVTRLPAYLINYSYIGWILPLHYSKEYMGIIYQFIVIAYILSPVITGTVASYLSYQYSFIVTSIIGIFAAIYAWIFVFQSQKKLEKEQMKMKIYYCHYDRLQMDNDNDNDDIDDQDKDTDAEKKYLWQMDKSFRFPSVLESISNDIDKSNNNNEKGGRIFSSIFLKLSKYEWYSLFNIILQNGIIGSVETSLISYYCLYMKDTFDVDVIISTTQLAEMCFGLISGTQVIKLIVKMNSKKQDNNGHSIKNNNNTNKDGYTICNIHVIMCFFMYICGICLSIFFYSGFIAGHVFYNMSFYCVAVVYGFVLGCSAMTSEVILLDLQPKTIIGFVTGIKGFVRTTMQAFAVLIIGLYWDDVNIKNHASLWYGHALLYAISTILMLIMVITEHIRISSIGEKKTDQI